MDWLKVNTYFTFDKDKTQHAYIIRNHNGSIIHAFSKEHLCTDSMVAETQAILEACQFINCARLKNVIFEADCLNAIKFTILHVQVHWIARILIAKTKKLWSLWTKWRFKFCF